MDSMRLRGGSNHCFSSLWLRHWHLEYADPDCANTAGDWRGQQVRHDFQSL
jgi:hypothetical protein